MKRTTTATCHFCHAPYREDTGLYADGDRGRVAPACGPCYRRRHGPDVPHGHVAMMRDRVCPVCDAVIAGSARELVGAAS